ncbi:carbohydrate ABC transporter permease [Microbacterium sp. HJ5]
MADIVDTRPPVRVKPRRSSTGRPPGASYLFLSIVILLSVFPLYWSVLIASGDGSTLRDPNMSWVPGGNFWQNAAAVMNDPQVNFWKAIVNSIVVSTVVAASTVIFSVLAGYAFAKLTFRGRDGLLIFVVATMAVPTQLGVVPLFILMSQFQLTGSLWGVILPSLVSAFGVFWMAQYLRQVIPTELIEAARIDGANSLRTFWHVGVPAARPAAAVLALFVFVGTWTSFFWPYIILDQNNPTLPVALATLQAGYFVDYSVVLAGAVLATIPLVLLFVFAGKQLVAGIMQGAVKG